MHTGEAGWAAQHLPGGAGNMWAVLEFSGCTE